MFFFNFEKGKGMTNEQGGGPPKLDSVDSWGSGQTGGFLRIFHPGVGHTKPRYFHNFSILSTPAPGH